MVINRKKDANNSSFQAIAQVAVKILGGIARGTI